MTREEFDGLVRRVEQRYANQPAALRRRVVTLAAIGYAGLLAWLAIVVLISGAFFAVMFFADAPGKIACGMIGALILFGGGYAALRALLVRVPKPEGRAVTRAETPALFAALDELQVRLHSAAFHQVLIEPVCNAAVIQVPRLGVLGWQRNYLLIGLPLLDGMAPDEMRAVLAHEFAHLSREHGRLTHWLYRLRRSWQEVFERLSAPRVRGEFSLRPLVVKFVNLFWPRFNAHAFVLSRQNEYEADADAARMAGKEATASALSRLNIVSRQLDEKLWPALYLLANEQAEPPVDLFQRLRDGVRGGCSAEESARWLGEGLQMTSTNSDTHPCLTERLRALQAVPPESAKTPPGQSAAEAFLGPALEAIRADVQKSWVKEMTSKWRDRHARAGALKGRLTSLEQVPTGASMDADRLWDKALLMLDLEGAKAAKPLVREVASLRPDFAPAVFHLGRLQLDDNEPEGVAHLERAMELDEQCVPQACSRLHEYYQLLGRADKLRELDARMDRYEKALAASQAERREINAKDSFAPHDLTEAELQGVLDMIGAENQVVRAHLGRKVLAHFPKQRLFVLCVYPRRPWHGFGNADADRALVKRLSQKLLLPGRLFVFLPSGNFRAVAKKLARVPEVEVFRRKN